MKEAVEKAARAYCCPLHSVENPGGCPRHFHGLGCFADHEKTRAAIVAFLRACEPSDCIVAAGYRTHPCQPGETRVSDSWRAMAAAAAEEIEKCES